MRQKPRFEISTRIRWGSGTAGGSACAPCCRNSRCSRRWRQLRRLDSSRRTREPTPPSVCGRAFDNRIVVAVTRAAHARDDATLRKNRRTQRPRTACHGRCDATGQPRVGAPPERSRNATAASAVSLVALTFQPTTRREKQVEHDGQMEPSLVLRNARHVASPGPIGCLEGRSHGSVRWSDRQRVAGFGRAAKSALLDTLRDRFPHQALDALPAD
jgi:hypothetical protein